MLIQVNKKRTFLFGRKGTFSFGVDKKTEHDCKAIKRMDRKKIENGEDDVEKNGGRKE